VFRHLACYAVFEFAEARYEALYDPAPTEALPSRTLADGRLGV